jgi:hypothetical protein
MCGNYSLPESVISDRGPQFAAQLTKELNQMLGITTNLSTAFHPQTDRQTEQINQEVEQYLHSYINHQQQTWPEHLAMAKFAYNNKIQTSTKASPFLVNYGRHPRMGFKPQREGKLPAATDFVEQMKKTHEEAQAALLKSQDDMKKYADRHKTAAPGYKVGDKVMLSSKDINPVERPMRKLIERWMGPYPISKIVSANAVQLKLPAAMKIHPTVNMSRIKPWKTPLPGQTVTPPPPVEIEGQKEYKVEKVIDSCRRYRWMEYLVKWKGYSLEENTWEPYPNLEHAEHKVAEFHRKYPEAVRRATEGKPVNLPG